MAAVAVDLITEFGEACTFTRETLGEYNPAQGTASVTSSTTFDSVCFQETYNTAEVDGSLSIERDDIKLLVAPVAGSEPLVNDEVTFSDVSYRVLHVQKTVTNADTVLYILQVRE